MIEVRNLSARLYILHGLTKKGARVTIQLIPGVNQVNENDWEAFVPKNRKNINQYVKELVNKREIEIESNVNVNKSDKEVVEKEDEIEDEIEDSL